MKQVYKSQGILLVLIPREIRYQIVIFFKHFRFHPSTRLPETGIVKNFYTGEPLPKFLF